ncbi:uncharacterized protein LOC111080142 [Drosophila obscura]|uniref:uncharacterized protein LOC111080142 n=1 Tax=Drosophila obscura TaxID=7282 RepID=UPI001BB23908|nr:uncharacterized protein LOC111080142 [Drosophila obscura]
MAGTSILASICAGRLTKLIAHHSRAQSHQIQNKARFTAQVLSPHAKTAERCDNLKHYDAASNQMASRQMPKAKKFDFTSQWTPTISGCQRSAMEPRQPYICSLLQSKGAAGYKKLPVPVPVPGPVQVPEAVTAKPQPVQMSEILEASRKLPPILFPGKISVGSRAQMSPTLLMGSRYTMGPSRSQPHPAIFDHIKFYRNCF